MHSQPNETPDAARARRRQRRTHPPPGTDQGAIVPAPDAPPPVMRVIAFGPDALIERPLAGPDEIPALLGKHPVAWIDVDGLGDAAIVSRVGQLLGMHKL